MNPLDSKLVERFTEKVDAEDKRAAELMSDGMLQDIGSYKYAAGVRKGLQAAKSLIAESYEELMKE